MKIIISTNFGQLFNVIQSNRDKLGINLIANNPIIGFNENNRCFEILPAQDYSLYLVQDKADTEIIKKFIGNGNSEFILLSHSETSDEIQKLYAYRDKPKGSHMTTGRHYPDVFKILLDTEPDKSKRILNYFDIDGKMLQHEKLKFLNSIYEGQTKVPIPKKLQGKFNEALYEPLKNYSYNKDLDRPDKQTYQKATEEEKNKHNEMRENLKVLRDEIRKIN